MPRNKREGLIFGVSMALAMSLFMNIFDTFRHSGVSVEALGHALLLQPVIFAIVMIVENLVVSKLAHRAMKKFVRKGDSSSAQSLAQTVCMVTGMSLVMSAVGLLLSGAPLVNFVEIWPVNFCVAFFWQIFAAAPTAKFVLKQSRKLSIKQQAQAAASE